MCSNLLKGHPDTPTHLCLPFAFWVETPMLMEREGSADARRAKTGARGVEPAHGLTFPHPAKVTLKWRKNVKSRFGGGCFGPHGPHARQPAVWAAEQHVCSTPEPAHWKSCCPLWCSSRSPSESCSKLMSHFLLVFSVHQLSNCS